MSVERRVCSNRVGASKWGLERHDLAWFSLVWLLLLKIKKKYLRKIDFVIGVATNLLKCWWNEIL